MSKACAGGPCGLRQESGMLSVVRLAGGSKKGAYRLTMDDGGTVLLYAWNDAEDYCRRPARRRRRSGRPSSHPSGLTPFETAARRLASAGVRVLRSCSRTGPGLYPADIAVVETLSAAARNAVGNRSRGGGRPLPCCGLAGRHVRRPVRVIREVAFVDAGGRSRGRRASSHARRALASSRRSPGATCEPLPPRIGSPKRCTRWPSRSRPARKRH